MHKWHLKAGWALVPALLVGLAPAAFAQVSTGNIYGRVTDESQAVLPGVTATLSGPLGTRVTTSDSQGEFRFLNIDHGTHKIVVTLAGFAGVSREVIVSVGQNVNVSFGLKVAPVEETVIVTDETPVVDTAQARHQHHHQQGRAGPDAELARSLGAHAHHPGCPRRPRERGRQRERPAVAVRVEGRRSEGRRVVDRRHRHHRHGGGRLVRRLLLLRRVRRGQLLDGRQQLRDPDGRPRRRHRHQARHQRVPRQRQRLLHERRPAVVEHPRRARRRPAPPGQRQGRPHGEDHGHDVRPGRSDPEGQALVLRQLRRQRHQHPQHQPDARQDDAQGLQRQAELAGDRQRHGLGLLVPGRQDQGPAARARRVRSRTSRARCGTRARSGPGSRTA